MPGQRIKIGLLIDNFILPAWIYEMLKRVNESEYATISLIIKNELSNTGESKGFNNLAYSLYRKLESKIVKTRPDAFLRKNITDIIGNAAVLEVESFSKEGLDHFEEKDIALIASHQPDVILKLGTGKFGGGILNVAKYGLWAYQIGDYTLAKGVPAGVWEAIEGKCSTGISLKILKENGETDILCNSYSSTNVAINKNINLACWKAVSFVPRQLKKLYENADIFFLNVKNNNLTASIQNNKELYKTPGNSKFIAYLFKRYYKFAKRKLWKLFHEEQWILLYSFHGKNEFPFSNFNYKELMPPKDKFWADPCDFTTADGRHFIFFEEFVYKTGKAHLSVVELDESGKISQPKIILEKPYHLSYPFVFNVGEDIFMVPESIANKTIELYKCKSFPYEWEFRMNLMENIEAVDTTIHFQDGKYWMFVNIKENKGASAWDELFLFSADTLQTANWQPHPQNPVISDVRAARPAGRLFTHNGKLYRPSQDCSCTYGYATNINEVLVLNEKEYSEKRVDALYPKWNKKVTAVHTLSHSDGLSVIDARYKRRM